MESKPKRRKLAKRVQNLGNWLVLAREAWAAKGDLWDFAWPIIWKLWLAVILIGGWVAARFDALNAPALLTILGAALMLSAAVAGVITWHLQVALPRKTSPYAEAVLVTSSDDSKTTAEPRSAEGAQTLDVETAMLKSRAEWWRKCRVPVLTPVTDPRTIELCSQLVRSHHVYFMELSGMARTLVMELADQLEVRRDEPQALLWKFISRSSSDLGQGEEQMVAFVKRNSGADPRQVLFAAWLTYRRVFQWIQCLAPRIPGTMDSEDYRRLREAHDAFIKSMSAKMDELSLDLTDTLDQSDNEAPC